MNKFEKLFQLHAEAKAFNPPVGACAGGHKDIPQNGGACKRCGATAKDGCRNPMDSPQERLRFEFMKLSDDIIKALKCSHPNKS